jgi:hypothetical protein
MSVGSISGNTFNPQAMASKMAANIIKEADKDGNGTLSKAELTAFKASKGGQGPNVDEVFSTYNKSGDGELTQSELQSSIETEGAKMQGQGGGPVGGPPPTQMATGTSPSASSSSGNKGGTDPLDTNKDGRVSEAELQAYYQLHPDLNKLAAKKAAEAAATSAAGHRSVDISA